MIYKTILLLLVTSLAWGQEIILEGPTSPIYVNCKEYIYYRGIKPEEMAKASVYITPGEGAFFKRGTLEGEPMIAFEGRVPNKYTVTIGINVEHVKWRRSLASTLQEAADVGLDKLDPVLFGKLKQSYTESGTKYPSRGGSIVIEVIPIGHKPPVDPPDPVDPSTPTDFEVGVKNLTAEAIKAGGTRTTAVAISNVFLSAFGSVASGQTTLENALPLVSDGIRQVFKTRTDEAKWVHFRTELGEALDTLRQDGKISTKEEYAGVFKEIANGMSAAAVQ